MQGGADKGNEMTVIGQRCSATALSRDPSISVSALAAQNQQRRLEAAPSPHIRKYDDSKSECSGKERSRYVLQVTAADSD